MNLTFDQMVARSIAEQGTILSAEVGSIAHGTNIETSDRDEMAVCIEPPEWVIGFKTFEEYKHRPRAEGERSQPGDVERTTYSLRKWSKLALAGNPSMLVLLFAPNLEADRYGQYILDHKSWFISKAAYKPFRGYMQQQRERLAGVRGQKRVNRPELEEKYGFDTKYAYHLIRLGIQGVEFLGTGRMNLPMQEYNRQHLLNIRNGQVPLESVLEQAVWYEELLTRTYESSSLPDQPKAEMVNRMLCDIYQDHWSRHIH